MHESRQAVAVAICTYRRNEPLTTLLTALLKCEERVRADARIGVVVVDDTAEGRARAVADNFSNKFELGVQYYISGKQNISMARNTALNAAANLGDWIAMIDDDCEPPAEWLLELLRTQRHTRADAVTGRMRRRVPPCSPAWLVNEPFLQLGMEDRADGEEVSFGSTFNCLLSSEWLKAHPDVRFMPSLGMVGGEDTVFFRSARAAGMRIHYSALAFVFENEPPERANLKYQLRLFFWHGNSSYISSVESGVSAGRMFIHGLASLARAGLRPILRIATGRSLELRYTLALVLHAFGKLSGVLGMRIRHK